MTCGGVMVQLYIIVGIPFIIIIILLLFLLFSYFLMEAEMSTEGVGLQVKEKDEGPWY